MNYLTLHILQSLPASCLNRGEDNAHKTIIFGGLERLRLSSQSMKRAVRQLLQALRPDLFSHIRTKLLAPKLAEEIRAHIPELSEEDALIVARKFADVFSDSDSDNPDRMSTILLIHPNELNAWSQALAKNMELVNRILRLKKNKKDADKKDAGKKEDESVKKEIETILDNAFSELKKNLPIDLRLNGARMVAKQPNLKIESAISVAHAISTHKSTNQLDFFTAVDDLEKDSGAAHTQYGYFDSGVVYGCICINMDQLALNPSNKDDQDGIRQFLEACVLALPSASNSSKFANSIPQYVLGVVGKGVPTILSDAFENPIRPQGEGLLLPSVERLREFWKQYKVVYDIVPKSELELIGPAVNSLAPSTESLKSFVEKLCVSAQAINSK
jgi:CRISPR system Cascade subunit CasC